jgi:hypothetical protein
MFCIVTFSMFGFTPYGKNNFILTLPSNFKSADFNQQDLQFVSKLYRRFSYNGDSCIYSKTNLTIVRDGKPLKDCVYQNRENKSQLLIDLTRLGEKWYYLVINRDLNIIGQPGTGGISYHPNPSRTHIICLNCKGNSVGVPIDDGIKGEWPKTKFSDHEISWTHSFVDRPSESK